MSARPKSSLAAVEGVRRAMSGSSGTANYTFSASGALVYVPGPAAAGQENLMLFDRKGMAEVLKLPTGPHQYPRVAPDGRKIAFETSEGKESFIAVYDLSGASSMRRLTFGGNNHVPLWSRDSRRVAFQSDREGDGGIFWQSADGGPPERLTKPGPVMVTSTACHTP